MAYNPIDDPLSEAKTYQLGRVAAHWAYLEREVDLTLYPLFLHGAMNAPDDKYPKELSRRLRMGRKAINHLYSDRPYNRDQLLSVLTEIKEISSNRNLVLKGVWYEHKHEYTSNDLVDSFVGLFSTAPSKNSLTQFFSSNDLKELADKIGDITRRFQDIVRRFPGPDGPEQLLAKLVLASDDPTDPTPPNGEGSEAPS